MFMLNKKPGSLYENWALLQIDICGKHLKFSIRQSISHNGYKYDAIDIIFITA